MFKTIIILFFLHIHTFQAQSEQDIPIFHRLVILNADNEIMLVKIENAGFWVTPGVYQTKEQSIKTGLHEIASSYGIEIDAPKLNGVFLLKRDINGFQTSSLRHVYTAKIKTGTITMPKGIAEVKWLPLDKAVALMTFPHINVMIEQIMKYPDQVWGGSILQFKENDKWAVKILEAFYRL